MVTNLSHPSGSMIMEDDSDIEMTKSSMISQQNKLDGINENVSIGAVIIT